jgi:metal-dependent hydrolase (beta-lactamase superfamily II)
MVQVGEETMNSELSASYSFTQTVSFPEREGRSARYQEVRRVACVSALLLAIFLNTPTTGCADVNFFQIINGSIPAVNQDFVQDRGYAVYVSYEGKKFLMDTGLNGTHFVNNIKAAGIILDDLDFVFLSHKHRDHTTGWANVRSRYPSLRVYIPPGGGFTHPEKLIEVSDHLKISSNIILIHTHDDSGSGGVMDELALLIKTKKGPYLFTTNSHTDFFAKLEKAKHLAGQDIFFHSGHTARRVSNEETITANAKKMKDLNVRQVSPSHSDPSHDKIFQEVFGANYVEALLGEKVPLVPVSP